MMDVKALREIFHQTKRIYDGALLRFEGVDGYDVYNCSVPFEWKGKRYIFGRVERREDFANSVTVLFEQTGPDTYAMVPGAMTYPIEDPHVAVIGGELILGGTHVRKRGGKIDTLYGYFYRGDDPTFLSLFTCGPDGMKDIRLIELPSGKVGVFTRPRGKHLMEKYGSEAIVGYLELNSVDEIDETIGDKARIIDGLFADAEWGGCNQCMMLPDGRIGVIGHRCYRIPTETTEVEAYVNISFVFDPKTFAVTDMKVIGDKDCYPDTPAMLPYLVDCAFTSGIVARPDGKVDLYSGLGDVQEGRIVIDAPF